jgi:dephospho-CoA kinase
MLNLRKIAITGSLSSGKTVVCKLLEEWGACVVSADALAHELLEKDTECIQKVIALLGQEIKVNHHIDRKKVASLVFSDKNLLSGLENILHPLVFKKIETLYQEACKASCYSFFVAEVPLLFESGCESFFDTVITVRAKDPLCQERALKKGMSKQDYILRSARLMPVDQKIKRSDFLIENDKTIEFLKKQIETIIKKLK